MKKVLITGGAGFIGSHVAEKLVTQGVEVVIIDDFNDYYPPEEKHKNIALLKEGVAVRVYEEDIRNGAAIDKIFAKERPEVVIHLAARAGVRPSLEEAKLYEEVNLGGTVNMLEAAVTHGVSNFVFASSSSVYGDNEKIPFSEADVTDHPISPYAATKKAGELLCYTYHSIYKLPVTCLRFFTVYGPRQRPDLVIRKFMELMAQGETIPIYGDGSMKRDYTYIDDIAHGVITAASSAHEYEVVNLGNSHPVSLNELIDTLERVMGKIAKKDYRPTPATEVKVTYAHTAKAEQVLGYRPNTLLEDGVRKMYEWFEGRDGEAQ